ncbi:MAG TPA: 50S ribosomal protein L3 [Patescibacteria group bacterium]|nr:50S ribosomal protein L3 [Patescibacteria group bacterium]
MKFIIAKKIGMSQEYATDGTVMPVTILEAQPNIITQVKNNEKDGYQAVQLGFGKRKQKNISKPVRGHLKELGSFAVLKEFHTADSYERGQKITVEVFTIGDMVDVTGTSIGRGYAGRVKRHHFSGSLKTHGHKDQLRMSGSIGAGEPQHVFKGMRMSGQMGNAQVTVKNIEVVSIDPKTNSIRIKGAVPGAKGAIICIKTAKNSKKKTSKK